jgi:hypothetical protein
VISHFKSKTIGLNLLNKLAKYSVIFAIIPSIYLIFFPGKIVAISIMCSYPIILGLLIFYTKNGFNNLDCKHIIKLFFLCNIIILIRGIFDASSSQDFTHLIYTGGINTFFLPFSILFGAYKSTIINMFKYFFKFGILLCAILFLSPLNSGPFGFNSNFAPILILLLLSPYLNKSILQLTIILVIVNLFYDYTNRANLLDSIVAISIALTYFIRKRSITLPILKAVRSILLLAPIILFALGITGTFNIFIIGEYLPEYSLIEEKKEAKQELFVDSRTSIYIDVLSELNENKAFIFGLGGNGKTKTSLSDLKSSDYSKIYKEGRRDTESGMLNYIQKGGLIAALLYYLIFYKASSFALYKSKNWFLVMISIWLSFKCFFSFIEDPSAFSTESLFLFFTFGICFNKTFRNMTDVELKNFFNFK